MQCNQTKGKASAVPWYQLVHVCVKANRFACFLARGTCGLVAPCQNHAISQQTRMAHVPWLNIRVFADLELEARRRSSSTEPKRRVMWHFCPPFDDCGANPSIRSSWLTNPAHFCHCQQTFCSHHPCASASHTEGNKTWQSFAWLTPSGPFFGRLLRHISPLPIASMRPTYNGLLRNFLSFFFASCLVFVFPCALVVGSCTYNSDVTISRLLWPSMGNPPFASIFYVVGPYVTVVYLDKKSYQAGFLCAVSAAVAPPPPPPLFRRRRNHHYYCCV